MRLVIISSLNDIQAQAWYAICKSSRLEVFFLQTERLWKDWSLEVSGLYSPECCTSNRKRLPLNDKNTCWYFRNSDSKQTDAIKTLALLHGLLTIYAYPKKNFFHRFNEESCVEAKPSQYSLSLKSFPHTSVVTYIPRSLNCNNTIIKSISGIRSIAVKLSDRRLLYKTLFERQPCPVQLQEHISGLSLKAHFYRMRNDCWLPFCIVSKSSIVDYRYDDNTKYETIKMPTNIYYYADKIYELTGARFFDIDFIIQESDKYIYLETNFGPSPAFFEEKTFSGIHHYSTKIINDWLGCDYAQV